MRAAEAEPITALGHTILRLRKRAVSEGAVACKVDNGVLLAMTIERLYQCIESAQDGVCVIQMPNCIPSNPNHN